LSTRFLFVRTPWRPVYHVIFAAYAGVIGEGIIIDIEHWRHYFLILGAAVGIDGGNEPRCCGCAG
jgi:hypothetical protein